jgi:hypothetical protein
MFIKKIKFKIVVIEMLLNSDIQKKTIQIILHFQKEINVIMYIIGETFKFNFNHFIWTNFQ